MKKLNFLGLFLVMILDATSFVACSGDDDDSAAISSTPITVYAQDSVKIAGARNLTSNNRFVALTDGGTVKGFHVGETIVSEGPTTINVTVRGRYHTYDDPVLEWGCSKANVKRKQTQGILSTEKAITGSNLMDYAIAYKNAGSATGLIYAFKNERLVCVLAYVDYTYMNSFTKYLAERYLFLPEEVASYTYMGINGLTKETCTTIVTVGIQDNLDLAATYLPMSSFSSASKTRSGEKKNEICSMTEEYKKVCATFLESCRYNAL